MTELILPPRLKPRDKEETAQAKAQQLPEPSGYKILCAVPEVEDTFSSGLVKADITKEYEELLSVVLFVLKLGPDCYADPVKFPSGPWCKKGDFILVRAHTGARIKIHVREFRLINDDCVDGTVQDPRCVTKA